MPVNDEQSELKTSASEATTISTTTMNGKSVVEAVSDLTKEFHRLNALHFKGRLKSPSIEFSLRKSYGGYYQKHKNRIVLSWQAYKEHGWDETLNTFRHEMAHIVYQHHKAAFWDLAYKLGVTQKYASTPVTSTKRRSRLYVYQCPSCKSELQRKRRLRSNGSCARCDNRYNPAYQLQLIRSELK